MYTLSLKFYIQISLSIENIRVFLYFCYVVDNPITIQDRPVAVVQPMPRQRDEHDDDDDDDVDVVEDDEAGFMADDEEEDIDDNDGDVDANAHVTNILFEIRELIDDDNDANVLPQIRELINGLINYLTQQ